MECANQMQLDHTRQLATMQNDIETMKSTLNDLSTIKETLIELKIISKQNFDFNVTQQKSNKEVEKTLVNINENLNQLNKRVKCIEEKDLREDVSATEIRVKEEEVKSEKFKAKFTFYGVIAAGVLALMGILIPLIVN